MILPPYGSTSQQLDGAGSDAPMDDWKTGQDAWDLFIGDVVDDFAQHIWPAWDMEKSCWSGDAKAHAEAATRAENEICIQHFHRTEILDTFPNTRPGALGAPHRPKPHGWHYALEDFVGPLSTDTTFEQAVSGFPGENILYYTDTVAPLTMKTRFLDMVRRKYNGLFQIKLVFRRPRPQQTAFMFGQHGFRYAQGHASRHTGLHPSMISGHGSQGLLLGCALMEEYLAHTPPEDIDQEAFAQYAVDFGDRRVFAGVHYPTDNFASWIVCLRLIPHLFGDHAPQIAQFAHKAITEKSTVYRVIGDEVQKSQNQDLRPAWDLMNRTLEAL